MRFVLLSAWCALLICSVLASTEKCIDAKEYCDSTNYKSYVECVRKRQKRSVDCNSSCDNGNCQDTCYNCDCNSCNYASCQTGCNSCCNSCCNNYVPCTTNHCCHKTCHAQCNSSNCRSSCRQNCFKSVEQNTKERGNVSYGSSSSSLVQNSSSNNLIKHNVTTVIHLNNVINNTNVIDIPINLNSTNLQNVTLTESAKVRDGGGTNGGRQTSNGEQCCTVIGPKQCVSQPKPRCFHIRSQQCGAFCTTTIVHKEQQEICESMYPGAPNMCKQQVFYIPQPQPRCAYQAEWPYVRCGVQKSEACAGCYGHYVDSQSTAHLSCSPQCYDDGFGNGPLYRQAPVYRQMYSHVPPYNGYGLPYGGNSFSNPDFGTYGAAAPQFLRNLAAEIPGPMNFSNFKTMDAMINVGPAVQPYYPAPYHVGNDIDIELVTEAAERASREAPATSLQPKGIIGEKEKSDKTSNGAAPALASIKLQ